MPIRLAYIISAYKLPQQLARLVERLQSSNATFYIHVDAKSPPEVEALAMRLLRRFSNVHFLPKHVCHYGEFGHVDASLKGIRAILSSGSPCDYAILLTGQDYPIKSIAQIEESFACAQGRSFMQYTPMSDPLLREQWPDALDRFRHWNVRWRGKAYYLPPDEVHILPLLSVTGGPLGFALKHLLPERKPPPGGPAWGGGSYWNLSRACIEYVDEYAASHPEFVRYFQKLRVPDEHFFQTLLLNSPLAATIENDAMRFVDWEGATGSSPRTLVGADFERLVRSPALFARKFDESADRAVLDRLDREVLGVAAPDGPAPVSLRSDAQGAACDSEETN